MGSVSDIAKGPGERPPYIAAEDPNPRSTNMLMSMARYDTVNRDRVPGSVGAVSDE